MNGNVTDYINAAGATVAHREFDAFGNTIAKSGPMADDFNFWFSTKYLDHETGFYYYGYRFYSPKLMRWLNRDPIEEAGGPNQYGFLENNPAHRYDILGQKWVVKREGKAYAIAVATSSSDLFDNLAELLGLDKKDYENLAHTSDSSPVKCKEYRIPNTVYYHHGQFKIRDHIFSSIINIWHAQNHQNADVDRQVKFNVIWREQVTDHDILEALNDDYLYQYIFSGHGALDGIINSYKNEGVIAGRYTKYGINLLRLNACGSADKAILALRKTFYRYNEWEWNVALRGTFVGYVGSVNTFNEPIGWRITHGKNRKGMRE